MKWYLVAVAAIALFGCHKMVDANVDKIVPNISDTSPQLVDASPSPDAQATLVVHPNMSPFSTGGGWFCDVDGACHPTEQACQTRHGQLAFLCSVSSGTEFYRERCTPRAIRLNNESCLRQHASAFCFTYSDETSPTRQVGYVCSKTIEECNLFRARNEARNRASSTGRIQLGNISLCEEIR